MEVKLIMAKFFNIPFARNGDKEDFPFTPDGVSKLDFTRGYNNTYELPPDAGGTWVSRQEFNYLLYMITDAVRAIQLAPIRDFDQEVIESGGYGVGEGCLLNFNPYTREIVEDLPNYDNTESTYFQKIKVVSLKPNNVTNPYDEGALFDSWFVDDGHYFNTAIIDIANLQTNLPGYIKVNASLIDTYSFPLSKYKRMREYLKDVAVGDSLGIFVKDTEISFKVKDIRGYFMRLWSNGSTVDSNRTFNDLQEAGLPNITYSSRGSLWEDYSESQGALQLTQTNRDTLWVPGSWGYKRFIQNFNASLSSPIYKDNFNDVAPYNFNINLFIKV